MTKSAHIQEIVQHRESWLQAVWAHQLFPRKGLQSTEGEPIKILFPGWLNKGAGPDFHDARLVIGDNEFHGAVEVHLQSSAWYSHQHHKNPDYNAVVLHVVLDRKFSNSIDRDDGIAIAELELRPLLNQDLLSMMEEEEVLLSRYDRLPGRCGLEIAKWGVGPLKRLLGHAAENRMQRKVDRILEQWQPESLDQLLFQLIFKSLGFRAHAHVFEELAQMFPIAFLNPILQQPYRVSRTAVMARWFGACGFLSSSKIDQLTHPTMRKEYHQWQAEWSSLSLQKTLANKFNHPTRPQNSPERRLVGMYHHIYHMNSQGILKGWLKVLKELESAATEKNLKKLALQRTQELFATPEWEIWQSHFGWSSTQSGVSSQLIGKDRQVIIWANAIIPFFLAYARFENWTDLERLLYRIFIVFPAEPRNFRTSFMEKRLLTFPSAELRPRTLRVQQGLIQIHQDFCQSFDQGCSDCQLIRFLRQFQREMNS
ncbi:MAG: DUF2851 family protein [SAR324 cluster bacterium]|nr:DUF2851 family protein [SAR324 cluster bacterium]